MRVVGVMAIVVLLALAGAAPADAAARQVPFGFVGVVADGPVFEPPSNLDDELDLMVAAGVETVRVTFDWDSAQPYARFEDVPAGERSRFRDENGVPTDYGPTDTLVAGLARRGIRVLPVILKSPRWAAQDPGRDASPPTDPATLGRFAGALVRRYGRGGGFWEEHPELPPTPIRDWQVWNEPNILHYWPTADWGRPYTALLRAAAREIRAADPRARVVLAGLTNESWRALRRLYIRGARRYFDVVALHPFTARLGNVPRLLALARRVMRRYGDARKPIMVTELSWPSAEGRVSHPFGWETSEEGQARLAALSLRRLAAVRRRYRLEGVHWYTWMSYEVLDYSFDYAGLRRRGDSGSIAKPAFFSFQRAALGLEGCAGKTGVATRCAE